MSNQEPIEITAESVTPMLELSASVDQNSAGAWRGKVSVKVSGPLAFRSAVYGGPNGSKYQTSHYTAEPIALLPKEGDANLVNINAADTTEMDIRAVAQRTLSDMAAYVEATAAALNAGVPVEKKGK